MRSELPDIPDLQLPPWMDFSLTEVGVYNEDSFSEIRFSVFEAWTEEAATEAIKQGWMLVAFDGVMEIQKVDHHHLVDLHLQHPEQLEAHYSQYGTGPRPGYRELESDETALQLVAEKAAAGDRLCRLALFLLHRDEDAMLSLPFDLVYCGPDT